ncbi:hypothetical protein KU06062659_440019 [Flavobacterium psychrophilum]|jgi:hypothetical protein|nr:hypothetical protein SAMN02745938_11093 [Flavobacterium psychrophilum DSM 3660] [Flavobacterium psychrophilum DSM 3660 = ATCC 49418]SNA29142.1 hypothetical protein CH008_120028 [Flavobacterium psychrophilum]SNA64266.1 hypothetical protein FI055_10015 [Flavobacterium psychrophilum]SNA64496.1 hypothetical protein FRGDSA1882_10088 [Flavobacterium psychrophilum]SNA64615.1 hypothetical protein FI070_100034 [Flavobacterium psychrophilum]
MSKLTDYYKSLNPLHLFIFGTVFMLLARTAKDNFTFEISCLLASLILYVLALIKYLKK